MPTKQTFHGARDVQFGASILRKNAKKGEKRYAYLWDGNCKAECVKTAS